MNWKSNYVGFFVGFCTTKFGTADFNSNGFAEENNIPSVPVAWF